MDLEIIKTVLTVAQLKSFSSAAYSIPCAQSSVSRRVKSAEDELNVKIFYRPSADDSKSVEITPIGEKVIMGMAKIVDDYSELYRIAESEKPSTMLLNIGIREYIMTPIGISLLKGDFFEQYPNISIYAKFNDLNTLISELRMRHLDAVLFVCASLDNQKCDFDSNMELIFLGKSAFSVGVSSKNHLAKKDTIRLSDLKYETFLMDSESGDKMPGVEFWSKNTLNKICKDNFVPETKSIPNIMREGRYKLTVENKGIFPSFAPRPWRKLEGITYLSIGDVDFPSYYYLLHLKGRKEKEVAAFANFFSKQLFEA